MTDLDVGTVCCNLDLMSVLSLLKSSTCGSEMKENIVLLGAKGIQEMTVAKNGKFPCSLK